MKAIISGGGTGGHIFPALSIADKLKERDPEIEILFIGAENRMEMEKVPAAGYDIVGLPVAGLKRSLSPSNLLLPFKVLRSYLKAGKTIKAFKPDVVIGVGGYASAPTLWYASHRGIPCLIQEQNSFAGLTNRILAKSVRRICVAYDNMERFFPTDKTVFTGNPIRKSIAPTTAQSRAEGLAFYGLDGKKKQILIVGGSLGSRTLNESMMQWIENECPGDEGVEILWQCGKFYKAAIDKFMEGRKLPFVHHTDFIARMDLAYAAADVVISRSGASSISELCVCRKATIFVPSPNVTEDHQTFNAMSLVNKGAARIVKDDEAKEKLMTEAITLARSPKAIAQIQKNIAPLGVTDAADRIVNEIEKILGTRMERRKNVYFIGIGGIGMSALARYYKSKGFRVSGYDRTPSELTHALENEGIEVHYEDNVDFVPKDVKSTLVVYTPAIPADMGELVYVNANGYRVIKRSRMLGKIAEGNHCLAVAGTHGKTTTSTLLGHILHNSGIGCNAILGGISKNYDTNLLLSDNDIVVTEADEFDRSFLQLHPEIAVITAMDADHLDIYSDIEHVHDAFRAFASQVSGVLIAKTGLPIATADTPARLMSYSYDNADADFYASDMVCDEFGHYTFTINHPGGKIENCRCGIPGWVNVENSIAAAAAAICYGVPEEEIKKAIECYSGVKRRFDIHVNNGKIVYIDDYAHHPEELAKAISSIRGMFPGRKLTAIFQPHLYSRTRDFAGEFAKSLSAADKVILLDIYPAREEPIPGVTSEIIYKDITADEKMLIRKEELMDTLAKEDIQVLVSFGAGNIDRFIKPITELLEK
ncbi:MAG: UDP-N-acetylmuramate--L-alanine ligase [Bacteroidales bacterium]|nr:UDP-N-acetylmuramate--L-alanine ligase [Candidatus Hennigimonas equi]